MRENSAPSRGGRSTTSVPSIEDAQARDRLPRRIDPIEDGTSGASSFGPQRSRERRARSPLPITDQRDRGSRDSSRRRRLTDVSAEDVDGFVDTLEFDSADELAREAMVDDVDVGPWAPTGVDDMSMPSRLAQPFGPPAAHVMAAQYNNDFSVTNQMVASSDQRSVTINQGLTLPEVEALVGHEVGQSQALADAAFKALKAESSSALSAANDRINEANQRADSIRKDAEERLRQSAEREEMLSVESKKMVQRADQELSRAHEEARTVKADAERKFDTLVREVEVRIKEAGAKVKDSESRTKDAETKARVEGERAREWAEQKVEEEKRRATFDANNELARLKEELAREVENSRRLRVDQNSQYQEVKANADRI